MKVNIDFDEKTGDVEILCDPNMTSDDLADWLMAVAGGLAIEQAMKGELSEYPPTMMQ